MMSVGIVGKMPWGKGLGDFLRLLLKRRFIVVPGKRERARVMDPQSRIVALSDKHEYGQWQQHWEEGVSEL